MIFASTSKNKEELKKYTDVLDEIKNQIKAINGEEPIEHKKYFIKIRFKPDGDLHLGKILSIPSMIIVVKSGFQEDNKYYPMYKFLNEQ